MSMSKTLLAATIAAFLLAGCNKKHEAAGIVTSSTQPSPDTAQPAFAESTPAEAGDGVAVQPFDPQSVPLSQAALGAVPFIVLPHGYAPVNTPVMQTFARFPFWLGRGVQWVEGEIWSALIRTDSSNPETKDKQYSELEFRRNMEAALAQAGAKTVFDGELPDGLYDDKPWSDEIRGAHSNAVIGMDAGHVSVHVIRTADREVWVQMSTQDTSAQLVVLGQQAFQPSFIAGDSFPYLSLPKDYDNRNAPVKRDFDRFPFWDGQQFQWVEGRLLAQDFDVAWPVRSKTGRKYSLYDTRRNLENWMAHNAGVKVFEGKVPVDQLPERDAKAYEDVIGSDKSERMLIYRGQHAGNTVWMQLRQGCLSGQWVIVERKGMAQTAGLLPASELKKQIDATGKVALQVNFATDKTDILPDSLPQIEQVAALLKDDPSLKLAVNGHTDNTGDAAHNQQLSEGRAKAVVALLTGKGIEASRLSAAGFGAMQPVADNGTDEGKAKNRRVELVKR